MLSNKKSLAQPTRINLHCNEYSQELHYWMVIDLCRSAGSCNILNELSNKVCVPKEIED